MTGLQTMISSNNIMSQIFGAIMVDGLKRGDKVVTTGGIVGTVERIIDNEKVEVNISENVNVEIVRSSGIQGLVSTVEPKK